MVAVQSPTWCFTGLGVSFEGHRFQSSDLLDPMLTPYHDTEASDEGSLGTIAFRKGKRKLPTKCISDAALTHVDIYLCMFLAFCGGSLKYLCREWYRER